MCVLGAVRRHTTRFDDLQRFVDRELGALDEVREVGLEKR
jgi:hypothetical protein